MAERPRATVGALMERDGKVLLQLRNHKPFEGCWGLPGGHIEKGEKAEDAIRREVKEETGMGFSPSFLCYSDEICPGEKWHALVIMFTGAVSGQEKPDPDEVRELRWIPLEEATGMGLAFGHQEIIKRYVEEKHA